MIQLEAPFVGTARDCVVTTLGDKGVVNEVSRLESRVEWNYDGYSGFASDATLRCGIQLCISEGRCEHNLTLPVDGTPTDLMFTLSRGTGVTVSINDGPEYFTEGGTLEITQTKRPIKMLSTLASGAHNEFVVLSLAPEKMRELLSISELPSPVRNVVESEQAHAREIMPMGPELSKLADDLFSCANVGLSRQLHLEGKGLQLLAKIFDHLCKEEKRNPRALSPSDVQRVQKVKDTLVAHMNAPPALRDLAHQVGINQTKLKADFRALFGTPIYSYLRDCRMAEAHRLLLTRDLNVTEVAARTGYTNPSKFASAFRKHFGVTPSFVARR